jgi:RNA polymerase sigma-70 factor (ECF subfamily)
MNEERSQFPALEEQILVARMRSGAQQAFEEFFDAYAPRVGAFAARRTSLDAAALEDVVQVTMINAMRGLDRFRGSSALFTWLCQICRNHLADGRRKAATRPGPQRFTQVDSGKSHDSQAELTDFRDPLDECAAESSRKAVRRALNRLPAHHSRILELRFGDELTVPQIARILELSESAAESRLVRARQAFRDAWTQEVVARGVVLSSTAA